MRKVVFNEIEWEKLDAEPPEYLKFYWELRWRMDKTTRLVGYPERLNESALRAFVTVERKPGCNKKESPFSRKKIRWMVDRLITVGLLKRRLDIGELVFELILAESGKEQSKGEGPRKGQTNGQVKGQENNRNLLIEEENQIHEGPSEGPSELSRKGLLQVSSNNINTTLSKRARARGFKTPLPANFEVTADHRAIAKKEALPAPDAEIDQFRDHFLSTGERKANWDATFRNWLRRSKKYQLQRRGTNHGTHPRQNQSQPLSKSTPKSATEAFWANYRTDDDNRPSEVDITPKD